MINHEALSSLFELAIDRLDFATKYDEFTPGFFDDFLAVADIINAFGTPFSGRELVESSDKRRCVGSNPDGSDEYVRTISVSIWNPISRTESFLGSGEWRESEQFSWESGIEKSDSRSQRTRDFPIRGFENHLRRLLTGFRYFVVDVSHTDAIRLAESKVNFRTKNIVGRYAVINSDLPQAMHTLLATTHLLPSSEALIRYFYLPDAAEEIVNALKRQNTDGSIEQEAATAGAEPQDREPKRQINPRLPRADVEKRTITYGNDTRTVDIECAILIDEMTKRHPAPTDFKNDVAKQIVKALGGDEPRSDSVKNTLMKQFPKVRKLIDSGKGKKGHSYRID